MAADVDAECLAYENRIRSLGGIDLQLLGLGKVGHIGFNEPLSALLSRTRAKSLAPITRQQNACYFSSLAEVPTRAMTMGVGTILDSKRCLMLVTGKDKASILAQAVEGPITASISASALQLHPKCTVIVDEEAASELKNRDYYAWVFENEPEWAPWRS
jgi:glucosamine-6-phosphate deaminase